MQTLRFRLLYDLIHDSLKSVVHSNKSPSFLNLRVLGYLNISFAVGHLIVLVVLPGLQTNA